MTFKPGGKAINRWRQSGGVATIESWGLRKPRRDHSGLGRAPHPIRKSRPTDSVWPRMTPSGCRRPLWRSAPLPSSVAAKKMSSSPSTRALPMKNGLSTAPHDQGQMREPHARRELLCAPAESNAAKKWMTRASVATIEWYRINRLPGRRRRRATPPTIAQSSPVAPPPAGGSRERRAFGCLESGWPPAHRRAS